MMNLNVKSFTCNLQKHQAGRVLKNHLFKTWSIMQHLCCRSPENKGMAYSWTTTTAFWKPYIRLIQTDSNTSENTAKLERVIRRFFFKAKDEKLPTWCSFGSFGAGSQAIAAGRLKHRLWGGLQSFYESPNS